MKVAFDYSIFMMQKYGGVSRYFLELYKAINKIVNRLNVDVESMEGASIFKVCNEFGVSCVQIRAISNNVEKRNKANWNMPLAIHNLNNQVAKIIMGL